jgi:O-antigen ligase
VVCLIVLMPLSASTLFPHSMAGVTGLNPLNVLLLVTLASLLLHGLPTGGFARFAPRPVVWLYIVPIVLAGLLGSGHVAEIPSSLRAADLLTFDTDGGYLRDRLAKPLLMVLFALLVGAAVARSKDGARLIWPMMLSIWAMCLMTIGYVALSGASLGELSSSSERQFLSTLGLHANDLGRLYAVAYAMLLFTAAAATDYRLKITLAASMALVVVALTLTFSRGAFFGFAVVNLWYLLSRRSGGSLILGAPLIIAMALLLPGAVLDRIGTGWGAGIDAISAGRVDGIWLPLLPEIWRSPIYGNGLGATLWSDATRSGVVVAGHPHNAYLEALLDTGIIGLVLLCAYFWHVWRGLRRLSADPSLTQTQRGFFAGAAVGLFSFLLAGFAGSSLVPCPEQIYLWLAIGMMYGHAAKTANGAAAC